MQSFALMEAMSKLFQRMGLKCKASEVGVYLEAQNV